MLSEELPQACLQVYFTIKQTLMPFLPAALFLVTLEVAQWLKWLCNLLQRDAV